ncbi:MAG: copper amine oxidase N-terminal domain-containing protein [Candidatus Eremiobacteraeota bacterium]|nr:copper amine oxidase N-terminal domain-containing protein [Candidatus Eremiobacteraeota bacterium]
MIRRIAIVAGVALAASIVLAFSRPIAMFVDGERVDTDVAPVTTSEKVFVPLRSIADALGAEIEPSAKAETVAVVLGSQSLRVRVGDNHATLNGMPFTLKHAPFRVRGRVMISLDAVARALHVHAKYDARDARIEVLTPGIGLGPGAPAAPAQ